MSVLKTGDEKRKVHRDKMRVWRAKNKDKARLYSAENYQKNKKKLKEQRANNYKKNPQIWALRDKKWRKENPEKAKLIYKRYRQKYPEKVKEQNAKYRRLNPEKAKLDNTRWFKENPDKAKLKARNRRNRERGASGSHTQKEWETLKAQYNWTCPSCKKKEPFEQRIKGLTEDHIIPLVKGGSDNIENIQPLCLSCNCKKHIKIINFDILNNI